MREAQAGQLALELPAEFRHLGLYSLAVAAVVGARGHLLPLAAAVLVLHRDVTSNPTVEASLAAQRLFLAITAELVRQAIPLPPFSRILGRAQAAAALAR